MTVRIRPRPRGPLAVELGGPCEVLRLDGTVIDTSEMTRILLCRCGHTATPPVCDGSHYRVDFERPADPDPDPEPSEP